MARISITTDDATLVDVIEVPADFDPTSPAAKLDLTLDILDALRRARAMEEK